MSVDLPRVLIIDDLFGRHLPNGTNEDRDNLCASFMLRDATGEILPGRKTVSRQKIKSPIAEAVFIRGQTPDCPGNGDEVRNDLEGTLQVVNQLWAGSERGFKRLSLLLLDLCFYTGVVTGKISSAVGGSGCNKAEPGMPEGRAEDIAPKEFFGLKLLKAIHSLHPDLPIVILSSQDRDKVSQEYSAHGALGFLPRTAPDGDEQLRTFLDRHGLLPEPHGLIVGRSLPLMKALRAVRRTAYNDSRDNILIRGERGVGKEEFARYIHRVHPTRARKDIISVNSAVLTTGLYSSELFGIEKRKATGVDKHEGAAVRAHQGDLFFDEVKDMIPEAQAALLRFLEEGTFTPTGAKEEREVDVRVISATNADLDLYAATSRFREDLLDRLRRGGTIFLPPLRDRKEDIPLLAFSFLRKAEESLSSSSVVGKLKPLTRQFSDEALSLLMADEWPGNIRVLRDVITKVVKDNDVEFVFPAQIEKARQDLGLDRSVVTVPATTERAAPEHANTPSFTIEEPKRSTNSAASDRVAGDDPKVMATVSMKQPETLAELIAAMRDFEFDLSDPDLLYNQLDKLDEAAAKLVVGYLLASLRMHKDHATGEPEITKAMQFLTGNRKLSTSAAYDAIKRLMKRNSNVLEAAMHEPLLKKAYDQAEANRPTNRKKMSNSTDE
jgi:DNA-binding NtrC family response regulator